MADQATDTLTEFHQCFGNGHFGKWIATVCADIFAARFAHRVAWIVERQAGDDDLRQGGTRHIDTGPETVGAKQDAVAHLLELADQFAAISPISLAQQRTLELLKESLAALMHLAQIKVTGEQDQAATLDVATEPADHIRQVVEIQAPLAGLWHGRVAGDVHTTVIAVVEGGMLYLGVGTFSADALLKSVDAVAVRECCTGQYRGSVAAEERFA